MPSKKKKSADIILIPQPDLRTIVVEIEGLSPLLVSKFSEKAQRQIEENQSGKAKTGKRAPRDPEAEFHGSYYIHPNGGYGFPASAFKLASVSACRQIDGLTMTAARGLFICPQDMVQLKTLKGKKKLEPEMDTRHVRLATGVADIRYRALFHNWAANLEVRYNARATTADQILNLLVLAGECIGIGELRPDRGGNLGRFTINKKFKIIKKAA